MGGNAGVQPAGVDGVADKVRALDHLDRIVNNGADLPPDLDLLQRDHHRPNGRLARLALGKQVPKLRSRTDRCEDGAGRLNPIDPEP